MVVDARKTLHIILAQRLWQAGSGLLTVLMIASFLDAAQQGWYFSLLSLAAFYTLFDFGLSSVLLQVAAPTFIGMHWGARGVVHGTSVPRFQALAAWSLRHYGGLAIVFGGLLVPAGYLFFLQKSAQGIAWQGPWLVLAIASAAMMPLIPFLAIVEGSGEVGEVYAVRLVQGVVGALAGWLTLISGAGLWAVVTAPLAAVLVPAIWLARVKPALLSSACTGEPRRIHWRNELWPHQWQIGIGLLGGYLLTQIYTPLLFIARDAVVAGQFGLTMTMSNMLGLLALSWVTRHVPLMAKFVAAGERDRFDALCRRDLMLSSLVFLGGAIVLCAAHRALEGYAFANRVLPLASFVALLMAGWLAHIQTVMSAQLRSFRREPLLWIWLASAAMTVAAASWSVTHYSVAGVVAAMLGVQLCFSLPASIYVWRKALRRWEVRPITADPVSAT